MLSTDAPENRAEQEGAPWRDSVMAAELHVAKECSFIRAQNVSSPSLIQNAFSNTTTRSLPRPSNSATMRIPI